MRMLRDPLALAAAVLVLAAYVAVLSVMPKHVFWSPDEGAKFVQMETVHWDGGLAYSLPYPGRATDPEYKLYPSWCRNEDLFPHPVDGEIRFHWPLWFTLASGMMLSAFGLPGLYVIPVLSGWVTAVLAGRLAQLFDPRLAPFAIVLAGFGTPLFFYSLCFWEHTLVACLGVLAVLVLASTRPDRPSPWWRAVPLLLAAIALRAEMMAFALAAALAWWVARRVAPAAGAGQGASTRRRIARGAAVAVVVLGAALLLPERHLYYLQMLPSLVGVNLRKLPHLPASLVAVLINAPGSQGPILNRAWEWLALAAFAAAGVAPFISRPALATALMVGGLLGALQFSAALAFSPRSYASLHGLLPIAPYMAIAGIALAYAWRARRAPLLTVALAGAFYLVLGFAIIFAVLILPDGTYQTGLEWGTRNMLALYPIGAALSVGALGVFGQTERRTVVRIAVTVLVAALMVVAVRFQVRGVQALYESRSLVATWQEALPTDEAVVTDVWWLTAAMAPFLTEHEMYCVRDVETLAQWLPSAAASGRRAFTLMSRQPFDPTRLAVPGVEVTAADRRVVSGLHFDRFLVTANAPAAAGAHE